MSFIAEPPGTLLDIGCGGGATGELIKEKFPGTRVDRHRDQSAAPPSTHVSISMTSICAGIDDVDLARASPR